MGLSKRAKTSVGTAVSLAGALAMLILWPNSPSLEPTPSLAKGFAPTRTSVMETDQGVRVVRQRFDLDLSYADALAAIAAEAHSLGLEPLAPGATIWSADFGGTDGYIVSLDTNPSRSLGFAPKSSAKGSLHITRRELLTTSSKMWDLFYRAEKRTRRLVGLRP